MSVIWELKIVRVVKKKFYTLKLLNIRKIAKILLGNVKFVNSSSNYKNLRNMIKINVWLN